MFKKLKSFEGGLRYDKKCNVDGGNYYPRPDPARIVQWKYKPFHRLNRSYYKEQINSYTRTEFREHSYF